MSSLLFARSWSRNFVIAKNSPLLLKPLRLTANVPTPLLNITGQYDCRYFSRKASKMGKHIEKLEELAHRPESEKAKEKKLKQNNSKQQHLVTSDTTASEDHNPVASSEHDDEDVSFSSSTNHTAEGDDESITLPTKDEVKSKMIKVVQALETSLRSVRGAEPTPELFDSVAVKVYGSTMPLNAVAQVVITGPSMAMITCFDPATASAVRDAIRDMEGMNFNPRMEENGTLAVPIPKVSVETRKVKKPLGCTYDTSFNFFLQHVFSFLV